MSDLSSVPKPEAPDSDFKYIVFKRDEFFTMMGYLALPPWDDKGTLLGIDMDAAPQVAAIQAEVDKIELTDAVVIRRQDLFASPALATYASCISLVAVFNKRDDLLRIADYFQRQSELAAEEGWKIPDV